VQTLPTLVTLELWALLGTANSFVCQVAARALWHVQCPLSCTCLPCTCGTVCNAHSRAGALTSWAWHGCETKGLCEPTVSGLARVLGCVGMWHTITLIYCDSSEDQGQLSNVFGSSHIDRRGVSRCGCAWALCSSSKKVSGLTPTEVFALATPKSPIDQGNGHTCTGVARCTTTSVKRVAYPRSSRRSCSQVAHLGSTQH
jgi:hypothetical protein